MSNPISKTRTSTTSPHSLLLIHKSGLSISNSNSYSSTQQLNPTKLPFPSRFPSTSTPKIAVSISRKPSSNHGSNIFLYHEGGNVVWEYDSKGRRISEINISSGSGSGSSGKTVRQGIKDVVSLGRVKGRETVLVGCKFFSSQESEGVGHVSSDIGVWEKGDGGRWMMINSLEGPVGGLTTIAANLDSSVVAAASIDEIVVYDQVNGTRSSQSLKGKLDEPISRITFAPSLPKSLVLLCATTLYLYDVSSNSASIRRLKTFTTSQTLLDITFSPVVDNSTGRKGGLCAVLGDKGEVALIGLDSPESSPKIITFGEGIILRSVIFLEAALLAATTSDGTVLLKDLRALSMPPVELLSDSAVIAMRLVTQAVKAPRTSRTNTEAPPTTSTVRTNRSSTTASRPLGEARNATNIETPLPVSAASDLRSLDKGKGKDKESVREATPETLPQKKKTVVVVEEPKVRVVSAPTSTSSPQKSARHHVTTAARSTSGPSSRHVTQELPLRSALSSRSIQPMQEEEPVQPIEPGVNDTGDQDDGIELKSQEYSMDLAWALRDKSPVKRAAMTSLPTKDSQSNLDNAGMEEMRRELGNLQLDMLRLGRGLKIEIRRAVQPLLEELRDNREVIERQRREIERLRRGF